MITYSIKELEHLSGIKAHTLRIWEKRYNVFSPERTDTNIRKYGADDLKRLLNICTLLENGWKISKTSELSREQLQSKVEELFHQTNPDQDTFSSYINALTLAMMEFDEARFEEVFASALLLMGMKETILKIVYPFLSKVGLLWSVWKAHPGQEHFASNVVRKKLFAATNQISVSESKKETFLLFLPEKEMHEIGLLFANYLIRSNGYRVIYLGQDVPFESLQASVSVAKPAHLFTFFITKQTKAHLRNYLNFLAENFPNKKIHAAGNQVAQLQDNLPNNILIHKQPSDFLELL